MPSLYNVKPKMVLRLMKKLGYYHDRSKGSHHSYKHIVTGKTIVIPVHNKDMRIGTISQIIKDLGVDTKWFLDNL
jgi:predicted RNA binding protein YcfA (HicA-like mRNA interferase family)